MGTPNIIPFANGQFEPKFYVETDTNCAFAMAVVNGDPVIVFTYETNAIEIQRFDGGWTDSVGATSFVGPAVAVFNNLFYIAYAGTDQQIYVARVVSGEQTSTQQWSYVTPSLAVFDDQLYMAYSGEDGALNIWSAADGFNFANKVNLGIKCNAGPSLAVFNDQLYMAFAGTDGQLYIWSSQDGRNFGTSPQLLDNQSNLAPSLATDGSALYMAFTGTDGRPNIWSSPDGANWDNSTKQISQEATLNSPALGAYDGKMYLGYTGEDGASTESILSAFVAFVRAAAANATAIVDIVADAVAGDWQSAISAMSTLISQTAFQPVLDAAYGAGMNTIGFVGGGEGGVVVGGEVLTGILTGAAPGNQKEFYSYLDAGLSIGTTEGGTATLGLYVSTEKPEDIGGLEFFTEVAGDFGVGVALVGFVTVMGGTGAIAFVSTGEEEELAVGVGVAISHSVP